MNYDRLAVFCFGGPIYGIGSDLDSAVDDANQWLDNDRQISVEDIEIVNSDMVDGGIYYASISRKLADKVLAEGGDIAYSILFTHSFLVTEDEEKDYWEEEAMIVDIWGED